jgi:acetyl-CoA decarbonylase/synthase complex subunit gamma
VRPATSAWTIRDRLGHWRVRWGIRRKRFKVEPGLYALGVPGPDSPALASANYRLSFDHLRRALAGRDAWILVLDTKGVNVWCAAGKGTFGTDELTSRLGAVGLAARLSHRTLIVPQLGATGIAAHEVRRETGFEVVFGPVRATDLPAFLDAGMTATSAMRRVTFGLRERLVLVPVELLQAVPWTAPLLALLILSGGLTSGGASAAALIAHAPAAILALLGAVIGGAAATPLLLPWVPGRAFSLKGAVVGLLWAVAAAIAVLPPENIWLTAGWLLLIPSVSAFLAMQFTGASVITSLSGVRREMKFAVPLEVAGIALGLILMITGRLLDQGG